MINAQTKLFCVIGHPIKHSKSPDMHNAALEKSGINGCYVAFDIAPEKLCDFVAGMRAMGITGANVTIPHKESIVKYLDGVTKEAEIIGAVNTIFMENGKLIGDNTDGRGFIISLMKDSGFDPKDKKVVVLGAGGASRAVVSKLADEGCSEVAVYDIDGVKSEALAEKVREVTRKKSAVSIKAEELIERAKEADLIVNCTPVGMKETDPVLLPEECFNASQVVYDLIYNPEKTVLLKIAEKRGARVLNGMGMLVYQGALAFEKWTGEKPDTEVMFKMIKGE